MLAKKISLNFWNFVIARDCWGGVSPSFSILKINFTATKKACLLFH